MEGKFPALLRVRLQFERRRAFAYSRRLRGGERADPPVRNGIEEIGPAPALYLPVVQTSVGDEAATAVKLLKAPRSGLGTSVQVFPFQCAASVT